MFNEYVLFTSGSVLYAFPQSASIDIGASGSWAANRVAASEIDTGLYRFTLNEAVADNWTIFNMTAAPAAVPSSHYDTAYLIGRASRAAGGDATVANQETIIGLLSSGRINWTFPVLPSGKMAGPIVIGMDYAANNLTSFKWPTTARSYAIGDATARLELTAKNKAICNAAVAFSGTVSLVSGNWMLEFEIEGANTLDLPAGTYDFFAILIDDLGNESIVKFGDVELVCGPR